MGGLSILICSLYEREQKLAKLLGILNKQIDNLGIRDDIEILIEKDNREKLIGLKRNLLLLKATKSYVCFIDDDDLVSPEYLEKILNALKMSPDCVGFDGYLFQGGYKYLFKHSIQFGDWFTSNNVYYRTVNHLNPIKRNLVLKVMFPLINRGEDYLFSNAIKQYLKKEVYIEEPLYYYLKDEVEV